MVSRRPGAAPAAAKAAPDQPPLPADPASLDARLASHNATVAAMGLALRIERRGGRLALRGPLPGRDGGRWRVQRLSLGLAASSEGLEAALGQLRRVAAALEDGSFDWRDWPSTRRGRSRDDEALPAAPGRLSSARDLPTAAGGSLALPAALAAFTRHFHDVPRRRSRQAGSRSTWSAAYQPYLRRLRAIAADSGRTRLSPQLLLDTLESYPAGTAARLRCAAALAALATSLELELPGDWRQRSGGYGLHVARYRQLPSDAQILAMLEEIPNPAWRLVYGLMATYGLRNHEVFFADLATLAPGGDRVLRVLPDTKTGEHQVWPFQPEWVEYFGLERLGREPQALPPVARDLGRTTLRQVGQRVSEQFRRYGLAVTPYDLRHAWAVRTIHIGLPDTVAARMMGHSVAIHTRTYHHWITRRDQQRAVDQALAERQPA